MRPTPTTSDNLTYRRADFATLTEALDYAARGQTGLNFHTGRGELRAVLPYAELRERAIATARGLVRAGLPPRARMLLVADTDPDFAVLFMACQYAGVLPVPVAVPTTLGGREAYVGQLRRQLMSSGAMAAAAPLALLPFLTEAAEGLSVSLLGAPTAFYGLPGEGAAPRPFGPDDPSYLQYSSGSTRFPLGVQITQRALRSNCYAISHFGLDIVSGDRCVSWLPLYHDMGLVGFMLVPVFTQMSVDYLGTQEFARRPLQWLALFGRNGGSLSFSPSFGYELAARRAGNASELSLDLRTWRAAGIGGDMIQPGTLARFGALFEPYGFRSEAFVPSYGMAETTLAVSFARLGGGARLDRVDRAELGRNRARPARAGDAAAAREFVICGRPLPGHEVEIRGSDGGRLAERQIGRLHVRGPSVMAGYFGDPEATAAVLGPGGWLDTGDLAYLVDGEVVITGRSKDLIIINGRNIWPQDLEWAVEELPRLRRGDVAAFAREDEEGRERVVLLVQCRVTGAQERADLVRDIAGVVQRIASVECEIALVPPHSLPQTSSGKLSRSRAKSTYLSGGYPVLNDLSAGFIAASSRPAQATALH